MNIPLKSKLQILSSQVVRYYLILFIFALGLTGCVECQTCDCFGDTDEVCESDFDSKDEYDAAIALLEAFGCSCS